MLIWINPDQLDLSSPQSEFTTNERTFSSCVLLHRLIITGQDEEILRRRHQLGPALLARTYQIQKGLFNSHSQVRFSIR